MTIFNKKSETPTTAKSRYLITKIKFFNMSKITTINPVLQRNGEKSSHAFNNQRDIKIIETLG